MKTRTCRQASLPSAFGSSEVLLYACSGAANVGAIADLAVRRVAAEGRSSMFCLASIASNCKDAIEKAGRARLNIVVDGCPLDCGARILHEAGIDRREAVRVTDLGIAKVSGGSPLGEEDVEAVAQAVREVVARTCRALPTTQKELSLMRKIEILGTGCPKCKALEKSAREAVEHLGIEAEIVKIDRMDDIISRGVMMTPAIAIDGQVRSSGRVLSRVDVERLLK